MDAVQSPEGPEGAGERNADAAEPKEDLSPTDCSVCFERYGMGDLEMVDLEQEPGQQRHQNVEGQKAPAPQLAPIDYCCVSYEQPCDSDEGSDAASGSQEGAGSQAAHVSDVMSRLKISVVDWTSVAPAQTSAVAGTSSRGIVGAPESCPCACSQDDEDDDDDDADDDDDYGCLGERAPTPDNTPEHTPSREFHTGQLSPENGHELFANLEAEAPVEPRESYSVLGRAWSRLMGRSSSKEQQRDDSQGKEEDAEGDLYEPEAEPDREAQTIEELEATLEEVRLDGESDDPVVSYLVEEAEDVARTLQGDVHREVVVEEVEDDDHIPSKKSSGLLARIFTRSRTSHEGVSHPTNKRGKTEPRDRLLHRILHSAAEKKKGPKRVDKPQQHAALRHTLPRMLSRWLGQNESSLWGAEGDAGETGVSSSGHLRRSLPHNLRSGAPQTQPSQPSQDSTEAQMPIQPTVKKMAEFASQTEETMWEDAPISLRQHKDSRGIGGMLGIGPRRTVIPPKPSDTRETC